MGDMYFRERVKSAPSKEAIELVYGPKLRDGLKSYDHMLRIHKAHAVMLVRQSVIAPEVGAALLKAVCDLQQQGPEAIEIDPQLGDLFYNI